MKKVCIISAVSALLLALNINLNAFSFDDIYYNGFFSQGYLKSSANNPWGTDSKDGTFQFNEAAVSAKAIFTDNLNGGIQFMSRDFGTNGNNDIKLDWAFLDFTWTDAISFRAGKFKRPEGIYNTIRDADAVRSSILLPQGIYSQRSRDMEIAVLGLNAYGFLDAGKVGSFNYSLYYGKLPVDEDEQEISDDLLAGFYGITDDGKVDSEYTYGAQVFWNTPIEGLRLGQSMNSYLLKINGTNTSYPWYNSDIVDAESEVSIKAVSSIEYQIDNWTFNGEYMLKKENVTQSPFGGGFGEFGPEGGDSETKEQCYYLQAIYDFNDRFQMGTYYTHTFLERGDDTDPDDPREYIRDWAISAKYNVTDWWTLKAEYHMYDGYLGADEGPGSEADEYWNMVALKTSFSF